MCFSEAVDPSQSLNTQKIYIKKYLGVFTYFLYLRQNKEKKLKQLFEKLHCLRMIVTVVFHERFQAGKSSAEHVFYACHDTWHFRLIGNCQYRLRRTLHQRFYKANRLRVFQINTETPINVIFYLLRNS